MNAEDAIRHLCQAWTHSDNEAIAEIFGESGVFADPLHPRPLVGAAEVRDVNRSAVDELRDVGVEVYWVVGDDERACAEGRMTATVVADSSRMDFQFAMIAETKDGVVTRVVEYFDTNTLSPLQ
jgi:ketosteroid isomerase-like protein